MSDKKLSELEPFDTIQGTDEEFIYMIKKTDQNDYASGKISLDTFKRDIIEPEIDVLQPDGYDIPYHHMIPDWSSTIKITLNNNSTSRITIPCDCFIYQNSTSESERLLIDGVEPTVDMTRNGIYVQAGADLSLDSAAGTTSYSYFIVPLKFPNIVTPGKCVISAKNVTPFELTKIIQEQDFIQNGDSYVPYDLPSGIERNRLGVYGFFGSGNTPPLDNIGNEFSSWRLLDDEDKYKDNLCRGFALYCPLRSNVKGRITYFSSYAAQNTPPFGSKSTKFSSAWPSNNTEGFKLWDCNNNTSYEGASIKDYKIMNFALINFPAQD